MRGILNQIEYTTRRDRFFDYCLWEYTPTVPCLNKFRSINLLMHSFEFAGMDKKALSFVQAIREGMGMFQSVWGVKLIGGKIRWEFYFYDYRRRERERSMTRLLEVIEPFTACDVAPNENDHYFMFSIDVTNNLITGARGLDEIHMYIGNPGSSVSSGICYSLKAEGRRLENFYFFFNAEKDREDILAKIVCSAHIDTTRIGIEHILWPEMRGCQVVVVANKQKNDSVYFSRITVDQFIFFLKKMRYPEPITEFVVENKARLDHLLYDVGIDYRLEGNELKILKSGYYGFF